MNAKDKEKLNLARTIVIFTKGDPIVIDPENHEKKSEIKNKEPETNQTEREVEELSAGIVEFLADSAANSFAEILDVIPEELTVVILDLLNEADSELFVRLIQAVFSIAGMDYAAEQLGLMEYCYEYDDCAYYLFSTFIVKTASRFYSGKMLTTNMDAAECLFSTFVVKTASIIYL